jgi:hypothetical protein
MKYGRNSGVLVVCIKNIIEVYVEKIITKMEEIIWIGMKD